MLAERVRLLFPRRCRCPPLPRDTRPREELVEVDRLRLSFAEAAHNNELERLGKITAILMDRPRELDDSLLIDAVQKTYRLEEEKRVVPLLFLLLSRRISLRFRPEGSGFLSLRDYAASTLGGQGSKEIILAARGTDEWLRDANFWLANARAALCDIVRESYEKCIQSTIGSDKDIQMIGSWCDSGYSSHPVILQAVWMPMYRLVRDIHRWRRLGEGRTIRLKDSTYFQWLQQWNLFGLPSAVAKIWLAQIVHQFMFPRWAKLKDLTKKSAALLIEILQVRFYNPSRDLFKEIMHRGPSMLLTEFAIDEEEAALDKMLKSLNFGDGTPESRTEALHKAMDQYEHSFASNFYGACVF